MDLWIRSQDKERLVKVDKIELYENKDKTDDEYKKCAIYEYTDSERQYLLGIYKSKERALEVLDEIQSILINKKLIKLKANLSTFDMNRLKKEFGADAIVETTLYEIANSTNIFIYEMPKE